MKTCGSCKLKKDESEFNKKAKSPDGLQPSCRGCQSIAKRKHYESNKEAYIARAAADRKKTRKWLIEHKLTLKCARCPENHIATLDFHHRDDSAKDFNIARHSASRRRLQHELTKCDVLCSNCHRKLHWKLAQEKKQNDN